MVELRILVLVGLIVTSILAIGTVLAVSAVVGWVQRLRRQALTGRTPSGGSQRLQSADGRAGHREAA